MTFDREALLGLEVALARRDEAAIPGGYEAVLAPDFEEIGASSRHWTRAEILELLQADPPNGAIVIERFVANPLSDDLVLATYDAVGAGPDGRPARRRRSSIWVRRDGRWQMRFNQGTPVDTERPRA